VINLLRLPLRDPLDPSLGDVAAVGDDRRLEQRVLLVEREHVLFDSRPAPRTLPILLLEIVLPPALRLTRPAMAVGDLP
jgi:hypothetical protein